MVSIAASENGEDYGGVFVMKFKKKDNINKIDFSYCFLTEKERVANAYREIIFYHLSKNEFDIVITILKELKSDNSIFNGVGGE